MTSELNARTANEDDRKDAAEGVGIGLGLGVGGPIIAVLAALLLGLPREGTLAAYAGGAVVGTIGLAGALLELGRLREVDAYETWGVSVFLAGVGGTLAALGRSGFDGALETAVTLVALAALFFAVIGLAMGAGSYVAEKPPPSGSEGLRSRARLAPSMTRYERLSLVFAVVGVLVSMVGVVRT